MLVVCPLSIAAVWKPKQTPASIGRPARSLPDALRDSLSAPLEELREIARQCKGPAKYDIIITVCCRMTFWQHVSNPAQTANFFREFRMYLFGANALT